MKKATVTDEKKAKRWLRRHIAEYVDKYGELNLTELAETCAISLYDRCANEEEFELAFEIATEKGL